jgi:Cu(I)/Ag(I) efflux system membrane fusion protein
MTMNNEQQGEAMPEQRDGGPAAARDDVTPFGAPPASRSARLLRAGGAAGVLAAAGVISLLATRGHTPAAASQGGHDHATMGAGAASAEHPVHLTTAQAERIGVTYATATVGPLAREVRTMGQVTFDETRVQRITSKVDGWVERLNVDYTGQAVRRGDALLAIYSPALVAAQEELLLAQRLAREVESGTADAALRARELVASARRRLQYWDIPESEIARVERAGEALKTLTMESPASGFVVEKSVLPGQKIAAGEALYTVADLSTVWIEGEVFEQDYPLIRMNEYVSAELKAFPGERLRGRIAYIYPTVSPETRTVRVRVELPNPGARLKPGMYATIRIAGVEARDVVSVPRGAVLSTGERSIVFVPRADGKLEPRLVTLGIATDDRIQILRGIEPGERVVASGTFLVDAESNLGAIMGGMGNMPGMDMSAPVSPGDSAKQPPPSAGHAHPMDHSAHQE